MLSDFLFGLILGMLLFFVICIASYNFLFWVVKMQVVLTKGDIKRNKNNLKFHSDNLKKFDTKIKNLMEKK